MELPARNELPIDPSPSRTPTHDVLDLACALRRLDGNKNLLKDLAMMYLEDVPALFHELKEAITSGDYEEVTRAAHSISGLSATFEAIPCCTAAKALEASGRQKKGETIPQLLAQLEVEYQRLKKALEETVLKEGS